MKKKQVELWQYVAERGQKDSTFNITEFSKMVGCHRSRMSRIIRYQAYPSIRALLKIAEITDGRVDPWDIVLRCSRHTKLRKT